MQCFKVRTYSVRAKDVFLMSKGGDHIWIWLISNKQTISELINIDAAPLPLNGDFCCFRTFRGRIWKRLMGQVITHCSKYWELWKKYTGNLQWQKGRILCWKYVLFRDISYLLQMCQIQSVEIRRSLSHMLWVDLRKISLILLNTAILKYI